MSPGVRGDVRLLPGRRGDAPLPAPHRPQRGAGRARGGVLPHAGPLPRPRRDARVLADRRARPRRRRAEPRRAAPPAGPRAARPRRRRPSWSRSRPSASPIATAPRTRRSRTRSRPAIPRTSPSPGTQPCPTTIPTPGDAASPEPRAVPVSMGDSEFELEHGSVVIAAITSCTNTSNPSVMVAAGLLAKNAVERGLDRKPWVKSSLAPGSKVVTEYYDKAGLTPVPRGARVPHRRLRLHDLHRELGAAPAGDLRGHRRGRARRLRRPLREPQLRGAHPSGGEGELPRLAAARGRLRARRPHRPRPDQ